MRTIALQHESTSAVEIDDALKEVERQMGPMLHSNGTPGEPEPSKPFDPTSLYDTTTEELDWLFSAFQSAADDLEAALDRIENECDAPEDAVEAASDSRVTLYTCVSHVERSLDMLRAAFEENSEDSAPA